MNIEFPFEFGQKVRRIGNIEVLTVTGYHVYNDGRFDVSTIEDVTTFRWLYEPHLLEAIPELPAVGSIWWSLKFQVLYRIVENNLPDPSRFDIEVERFSMGQKKWFSPSFMLWSNMLEIAELVCIHDPSAE